MVRPRKEGLNYFPLDIHFDEKIKALELLHKNDGLVWIIKFWQTAYSTNSGIVNLHGVFGVIRAENCRITTQKQADILRDCLEIGLITQISDGSYSSNGIQKRLNEIVKDRESERKRKLVDNFPAENVPLTGESKVKERKEKKRKEKNNPVNQEDFPFFENETFSTRFNDFLEMRVKIRKPATERAKTMILADLHKHSVEIATAMLEQAIRKSWQDVYPLKSGNWHNPEGKL